jgi:hypothetical protein
MKIDKIVPKSSAFSLVMLLVFQYTNVFSQNGIVRGRITEAVGKEPVPFANVLIQNTTTGAITDFDGFYEIRDLKPGLYNVEASYVGYKTQTVFEVEVSNNRPAQVNFQLESVAEKLEEVVVQAQPIQKN